MDKSGVSQVQDDLGFTSFSPAKDTDSQALLELQDILIGPERRTIHRLEAALSGFISAVIKDESLDSLLTTTVSSALHKHLNRIRDQINVEAQRLVEEAVVREIKAMRGDLIERLGKPVAEAIAKRINEAERDIKEVLDPVMEDVFAKYSSEGKQKIASELYPEVGRVIRDRVVENKSKVEEFVGDFINKTLGEGIRTATSEQLGELMDQVSYQTTRRNRRLLTIVGVAAMLILVLSLFLSQRQSRNIRFLREKIISLEKAAVRSPAVGAVSVNGPELRLRFDP